MLPVSIPYHFPEYTRGERMVDLGIHAAGLSLAAAGVPLLLIVGLHEAGLAAAVGLTLYAVGLLAMLACSASYNLSRHPRRKEILRRFDRAAIFAMIAGSYSPFTLAKIAGAWGFGLFAGVWALALAGAVLVFALPRRSDRIALPLYLAMGWCIVVAIEPLVDAVPAHVVMLLLSGGVVYTIGVAILLARRLRYHNALWHACVLAAAACHYVAVLDAFTLTAA